MSEDKPVKPMVRLEDLPEEEQRAVLAGARDRQKAAAIHKRQKPGRGRKERLFLRGGEARWFGLESYFDPKHIDATPVEDGGFMMGVLNDMAVVEIDPSLPPAKVERIGAVLNDMGIKALIVHKGIEFLRLRACTPEEEKRLDAIVKRREDAKGSGG